MSASLAIVCSTIQAEVHLVADGEVFIRAWKALMLTMRELAKDYLVLLLEPYLKKDKELRVT
jgi:hypothetical protein